MKKTHIAIIIVGAIFILLAAFHANIWFDEAYSCAIANRSVKEICIATGNDVHPPLYYLMLKVVSIITGGSIMAYRVFSAIPIIIMGILGYTYIRKEFGEKMGVMFSFLALFLPCMATYAVEIRMYSWAMLFATVTAIYAYKLTKENKGLNWVIFVLFSLAGAYTHYYGLLISGLINLFLFIYILKNKEQRKNYLIKFIISAIAQVIIYTPWLLFFITQLKQVSKGFWITIKFPNTLVELVNTQYAGIFRLGDNLSIIEYIIFAFVILFYVYIGYLVCTYKSRTKQP